MAKPDVISIRPDLQKIAEKNLTQEGQGLTGVNKAARQILVGVAQEKHTELFEAVLHPKVQGPLKREQDALISARANLRDLGIEPKKRG